MSESDASNSKEVSEPAKDDEGKVTEPVKVEQIEVTEPSGEDKVKNADESLKKDVLSSIDHTQEILEYQTSNGFLTPEEAKVIQDKLAESRLQVFAGTNDDLNTANTSVQNSFYELLGKLNDPQKQTQRLIYLYGVHIWAFLISLSIVFLVLIGGNVVKFSIFQDVPADAILWGGLGGLAFAFYNLRENVYSFKLSKYYAVYYLVYPLAGMIFGLAIAIIISAGLLSLQAKPTYPVYAAIAFLSGTFQQWIFSTLKDIAEAIHKTGQSAST